MFKVRRVDDGQPLELLISPLVTATLRPSGAAAMVIIADPTFVHEGLSGRLEQLHGLTPTEAEVAQWLLSGSSVNEIAEIFDNSVHTIRTHLKRIFAKTNTSSQAQLVGTLQRSLARML
jgi:DNA-binding CsgD family transcriptional regulator